MFSATLLFFSVLFFHNFIFWYYAIDHSTSVNLLQLMLLLMTLGSNNTCLENNVDSFLCLYTNTFLKMIKAVYQQQKKSNFIIRETSRLMKVGINKF